MGLNIRLFYLLAIPLLAILMAAMVVAMLLTVAITDECDSNAWRVGV